MTNFSDADVDALFNSITDLALRSGYFDSVNMHEPKSAPGNGVYMSVWIQVLKPYRLSGLAATTGIVVFNGRIYTSMLQQPFDAIDPNVTKAANWMMGAFSGEFQLGLPDTRNVDLMGASGYSLSAVAGYVEIDRKMFRVVTIQIPIIINDMWSQEPFSTDLYTIFNQGATVGQVQSSAPTTLGLEFVISAPNAKANGIWFYSPPASTNLPKEIGIFKVSDQSFVSSQIATWSGAAGSGWIHAPFSSPVPLSENVQYMAAVFLDTSSGIWYYQDASYWSSGPGQNGLSDGPLSAPGSGGQGFFNSQPGFNYPNGQFSSANFWVDVDVAVNI